MSSLSDCFVHINVFMLKSFKLNKVLVAESHYNWCSRQQHYSYAIFCFAAVTTKVNISAAQVKSYIDDIEGIICICMIIIIKRYCITAVIVLMSMASLFQKNDDLLEETKSSNIIFQSDERLSLDDFNFCLSKTTIVFDYYFLLPHHVSYQLTTVHIKVSCYHF